MLTVSDLNFSWHSSQAQATLAITHFHVPQGEQLFLYGPSGSGKSTLLSLLAGINQPQSGKIDILNTDLNRLSSSKRDRFRANHIGYIFQNFNLLPYLSPLENVCLGCQFSKVRQQRAIDNAGSLNAEATRLLNALGLTGEQQQKNVSQLSIGQQQRVAAARAFIGSPELIIADEPTSALDTANREAFVKLLFQQAKQSNTTLVFVSHDESLQPLFQRSVSLLDLQGANNVI